MISVILAAVRRRRSRKTPVVADENIEQEGAGFIDLGKLSRGFVPAHGLYTGASSGMIASGIGGRFLTWMRKLAGAVAIAGMIALGLFVYTEFTQVWKKRGLPTIPISALAAFEGVTQQGEKLGGSSNDSSSRYQPSYQRGQQRQQPLSLLDDEYRG